jgi:hypothetical protein
MILKRWTKTALGALCCALSVASARATSMSGLPSSNSVNATDTIAVCQVATGCGTTNPLHQVPMSAVLGTVAGTITGAQTLGNSANNVVTPVSGTGYAVTLPQSMSSTLPAGSKVILAAAPGAAVDVCVASGSAFDANSGAPLVSGICSVGSGVLLSGGDTVTIVSETGGNYYATLAVASGGSGIEAPKTANYSVSYAADDQQTIPLDCTTTACTVTMPVASSFPTGTWVQIVNEFGSGVRNDLIVTTSPSTLYGVPNDLSYAGSIPLMPGMGAKLTSDGTNWFVTQWGTIPSQDTVSGTSYTPDVWDCYEAMHFTSSSAVAVTIPTGLPPGCNMNMIQDGTGLVGIVAGSGFTLNAFNNNAHSAGQYADFFVNIKAGGTSGVLGGNIAP